MWAAIGCAKRKYDSQKQTCAVDVGMAGDSEGLRRLNQPAVNTVLRSWAVPVGVP